MRERNSIEARFSGDEYPYRRKRTRVRVVMSESRINMDEGYRCYIYVCL